MNAILRPLLLSLSVSVLAPAAWSAEVLASPSGGAVDVEPALVQIGPSLRGHAIALPADVVDALVHAEPATAAAALRKLKLDDLPAHDRGDWAFVTSWTLIRARRPADALPLLPLLDAVEDAPLAYVDLVRGEVLRAADQPLDALAALERVPEASGAWPRAVVNRAEILRDLGRTEEGFALYDGLAARPDPARGTSLAHLVLARHHGFESPEALPHLEAIWTWYPRSAEAGDAERALAAYDGWAPSWRQAAIRGELLMERGSYRGAIATLSPRLAEVDADDADGCRFRYALGRSASKARDLATASTVLQDMGSRCRAAAPDEGAKGQYLYATALQSRGLRDAAYDAWVRLGELYPDHTYGDDGFIKAAELAEDKGEVAVAEELMLRSVREHPRGDNAADAVFKIAFSRYLAGDTAAARAIAQDIARLPLDGAWVDVQAARYWAARWALYPDVNDPTAAVDDPQARAEAIAGWRALCEDVGIGFYALQAYARLKEVAPEVAAQVGVRPAGWRPAAAQSPWSVRPDVLTAPVREATALARLGVVDEAAALWESEVDEEELLPDEMAWWIESRVAGGDWLVAHDRMRKWLRTHAPASLGRHQAEVLRVAYPDRYWDEVQAAAAPYDHLDPRLMHALVREESNFNRTIQSHVGARGLAQLMPGTARETAGRLGISVSQAQLDDPATNLKLGAKYLEVVLRMFDGNPYLSLAGYNAGPGRVKQWLGEWGNVPTDEFVERIPYKETRAYVKRVMGTWQIMRYGFDDGAPFPDLSPYNHAARPDAS